MKKINIAIDGYSSCGKSTLAKELSDSLGYLFVDTGAMYRTVALHGINNGWISNEEINKDALIDSLRQVEIEQKVVEGENITFLNGTNVESEIRTNQVASFVSEVASIPEVRSFLVAQQQAIAASKGVVMDGRDIGTVVLPEAELKLFVTASQDVRIQRRYNQLKEQGAEVEEEEIAQNIAHRDKIDTEREKDPLRKAEDAILLDNSQMTREEQYAWVLEIAQQKIANAR